MENLNKTKEQLIEEMVEKDNLINKLQQEVEALKAENKTVTENLNRRINEINEIVGYSQTVIQNIVTSGQLYQNNLNNIIDKITK